MRLALAPGTGSLGSLRDKHPLGFLLLLPLNGRSVLFLIQLDHLLF